MFKLKSTSSVRSFPGDDYATKWFRALAEFLGAACHGSNRKAQLPRTGLPGSVGERLPILRVADDPLGVGNKGSLGPWWWHHFACDAQKIELGRSSGVRGLGESKSDRNLKALAKTLCFESSQQNLNQFVCARTASVDVGNRIAYSG